MDVVRGQLSPDSSLLQAAARVLARCDAVALCSEEQGRVTRRSFTPALGRAHGLVSAWMREAGLEPSIDEMGNIIGCSPESGPVLLLGSHLDSVPGAGKYDGVLGVLLAIEAVASYDCASLPFAIEVIGFSDEEGVRFRTPYLGSRAVAGTFDPALLDIRDEDEISLRQALRDFGIDPASWPNARHEAGHLLGYLEAHIEQGPVLEALNAPLGIVTAIAGQSRLRVRFTGHAGHAGTLPMPHRRDALAAASEWILAVEAGGAAIPDLMATVGFIEVQPNAPNVVPGDVVCTLDVRHAHDSMRSDAVEWLLAQSRSIAARRNVGFEILTIAEQPAVAMDSELRGLLHDAAAGRNISAPPIVSGAGHDAAVMDGLTPTTMLFLRTPGGMSHCPEEAVNGNDIALALATMHGFFDRLAARQQGTNHFPEGVANAVAPL